MRAIFPLLQRYVFREVLRVFVFVLGCTTVLLVFVGVFRHATESGLDPMSALEILPYVVPSMLPFTIPAALLLTVSVVYGRMSGDQEVTAAKTAGIHPLSLMWPTFCLGATLSVGSLLLTDQVIPWSMSRIEQHIVSLFEEIFLKKLETELQFSDLQHGLHVTVTGVEGQRLLQPVIRYARGPRVFTIQAEEAEVGLDIKQEQINFRIQNGVLDVPGNQRLFLTNETKSFRWRTSEHELKPRQLAIGAIKNEMGEIEQQRDRQRMRRALMGAFALTTADFPRLVKTQLQQSAGIKSQQDRFHKLKTEVHSRYALSCSCFFFSLLGAPFSMRYGKSQYFTSFLMCFIPIVAGYYPLMLGLMSQAKEGRIDPTWSMWVANAILALIALGVMKRVIRY